MSTSNTAVVHTIEEIVKEVPKYRESNHTDIQCVILDVKTGEILDEMPTIKWLRNLKYFEVNRKKVVLNIPGPEIEIPYLNALNPIVLAIKYDVQVIAKGAFNLVRFVSFNSPVTAINDAIENAITGYMFNLENFALNFHKHKHSLVELLIDLGRKIGLDLKPNLSLNIDKGGENMKAFVSIEHTVAAKTKDGQNVEIENYLALTKNDPIRFSLSGIGDLRAWLKDRLEEYTKNAVIEITYADVLVNTESLDIKMHLGKACDQIGYGLKQLITTPGLENEKFYFETAENNNDNSAIFSTRDPKLQISLNIVVRGRLDLHSSKNMEFIKPNYNIIAGIKRNVIETARNYINTKTPEDCFIQILEFEQSLTAAIATGLRENYAFKEIGIVVKFLENDLSKRISLLQERPYKIDISADWTERTFHLWFQVRNVAEQGWYRFRANNYASTEDELKEIGRLVKNGMESAFLRPVNAINEKEIAQTFANAQKRVMMEFGLQIELHDFFEDLSMKERVFVATRTQEYAHVEQRESMLLSSTTDDLERLLVKRKEAVEAEEDEEVIKKIDERIDNLRSSNNTKSHLLTERTGNDFLLGKQES